MKKQIISLLLLLVVSGGFLMNISVFGQKKDYKSITVTDTLMEEYFNYPTGQLPVGWVLEGTQAPWIVNSSMLAGGQSPELALGYSFVMGSSRLISPTVNVQGYQELCLKYKQYLINYQMDFGEIIGLDVTFDGGTTWQTLWEQLLGTMNIPQDEFKYYFRVPSGATEMKYAFRYEGNSLAINWWLIDDVILESVVDNDLLCSSFTGTAIPVAGVESTYSIEVLNGGKVTQTNYNVKLFKEGGIEIASVAGDSIDFAEKKVYELSWTPGIEEIGNSKIYGYIEYTQDETPENNQSKKLDVIVQPSNIIPVSIGPDKIPVNYLPYNLYNKYSITQSMYYPEEIGMSGDTITGILYHNQFDDSLQDLHVQILMGETSLGQIEGNWINPSAFTTVFDGMLNFDKGLNQTFILLDNPYKYNGGNLVIYSNKSYNIGSIFGPVFFNSIDTTHYRSRAAETDDASFDPMSPPSFGYDVNYYPNITLLFSNGGTSINTNTKESASVILYPNPVKDKLYIKTTETILHIKMVNSLGQVVYREDSGSIQHEINVSKFNPGFYMVQVCTQKGLITYKVQVFK